MKKLSLLTLFTSVLIFSSCVKQEFAATKAPQDAMVPSLGQSSVSTYAGSTLIKPKVDILILWDNTSSFNFVTSATKNSMNQLITSVSEKFDYHALSAPLVPTSGLLGEAILIASDSASVTGSAASILKSKDQAIATLAFSPGPGGAEAGIDRSIALIEGNRTNGIFRDNAYTLIVVMSNEDDKGCEFSTGYNACTPIDRNTYLQPKKNKLLCLRGNAAGLNCAGTTSLNSTMMRFMTVAPLTFCPSGLNKINSAYRDVSKLLYETPYTNGWPTSNDQINPDIANYPDSFNLCTIDFNHIFDGVNGAIKQTLLKHVYEYWPVAGANDSIDPDTLIVTRSDGKVLTNNSLIASPTDGFKYVDIVQTQNTRTLPTPGEPFTGKMIQLFGTAGNDLIIYPYGLTIRYDVIKTQFGYIYLKNGEPMPNTIEVKINGSVVPQSTTNGWDYMGLQFTSGLDSAFKIIDLPAGAPSGYFIRLNGSYQFKNKAGSPITVNVYYNPK
jgi:hypothetical protein